MKRTATVLIAMLAPFALGTITPAAADVDLEEPPVTISVGFPEGSGSELNDDAVAATLDLAATATSKPTCSTTAIPPQEIDVTDLTRVTARTELNCGDASYPSVLTVQFKYFGDDPDGPVGAGVLYGTRGQSSGPAPLTATVKLSKFSTPKGWYKTVGESAVTYNYRLNTRRPAAAGCRYASSTTIVCRVASSAVYVETLKDVPAA